MCKFRVTVIIPVYNGEKTIPRTLDSLLRQTYTDWGALVIDDGSTDETWKVVNRYVNQYPSKISGYSQSNIGQAMTRNKAIHMAESEFLMFVDADDYIDSNYIEEYVNAIESGDYDCVIGGFRRVNSYGKVTKKFVPTSTWLMYSHMVPWARLFRRQFLIDNDIKFLDVSIGEDSYFNFILISKTDKIKCIKNTGYVWYVNEESISFSKHKGFSVTDEILNLLNSIVEIVDMSDSLVQAWFVRYVVWYMLFSGRGANSDELIRNDEILFDWLKSHNVRLKFPVRGVTDEETIKIRFCVAMYLAIRKCGFLYAFSKMYCIGNRK